MLFNNPIECLNYITKCNMINNMFLYISKVLPCEVFPKFFIFWRILFFKLFATFSHFLGLN